MLKNHWKISKLVFILLIMVIYIPSHCYSEQEKKIDTFRQIELQYQNSTGEKAITIFYYNANGLMTRAKWERIDKPRQSLNYYTLDKKGNVIKKYREFSDGIRSTTTYKYDQNVNLIKEKFQRSDGVNGVTDYQYSPEGKLTTADCKGLNGWFHGYIRYKYSSKGLKTSADIEKDGKKIGSITYTYDEQENLSKELWDFNGKWSQTFIYKYETWQLKAIPSYTSSNVFNSHTAKYKIVKENYTYNGKKGGPSFYTYDKNGKLIKKIFKRSDDFQTETTYKYSKNGLLKSSHRSYSNGLTADFTYEFNGNRKLILRTFSRSDGVTGNEQYFYNDKNQLQKAQYKNMDSWLTGTITFEHDVQGNLRKGFFSGEKFNANIDFSVDNNGNVTKIHWKFSFSAYQTYTFTYEKI